MHATHACDGCVGVFTKVHKVAQVAAVSFRAQRLLAVALMNLLWPKLLFVLFLLQRAFGFFLGTFRLFR